MTTCVIINHSVLTDDLLQVVEIVDEYQTVCVPENYTDNEHRVQFIQDINTNKSCIRTLLVSFLSVSYLFVQSCELDNSIFCA